MDHSGARTEAKLARPRTALESAHRGIDNSDEIQIMIIFTLHAYRHRPRVARGGHKNKSTTNRRAPRDRSQNERSSGPTCTTRAGHPGCATPPCKRGKERLAFAWQAVRRRRMPSYATMKAKKPPMASRSRRRRRPSSQGLGTAYLLRLVPKTKQLRNLESMFTVSECGSSGCSVQPPLIHLPRGARLGKYREMRAGRGCHSAQY